MGNNMAVDKIKSFATKIAHCNVHGHCKTLYFPNGVVEQRVSHEG